MTTSKDSKDILAAIYGISRGNPGRATKTVARILQQSSNVQLKEQVKKLVNVEDDSLEKMILNGIRSGLSHPTTTRGPRTIAAEGKANSDFEIRDTVILSQSDKMAKIKQ